MAFYDDLEAMVRNYPKDAVKTKVVDVKVVKPTGGDPNVINVNDIFEFQVKVENGKYLDMNDVIVQVSGSNWVEIGTSLNGPWGGTAKNKTPGFIPGDQAACWLGPFYGRAKAQTPNAQSQNIVSATLLEWNADFKGLCRWFSQSGGAIEPLNKPVYPQ